MHLAPYKNFTFVLIGRLYDYIITLALLSGLARLAGSEVMGIYYFARSVATLTATFSELGLSRYTIKSLAEKPRLYFILFGRLVVLRILLSVLALLILFTALQIAKIDDEIVQASMVFASALVLFQIADLYLDVLRARETMLMPVLLSILQRTAYVGFAILGLILGYRLAWVLTAFFVTNLLHLVLSATLIGVKFGQARGQFKAALGELSSLFKDVGTFTSIVLLGAISGRIGVFFLYYFHNDTSVGYYGAAMHIVEALFYVAYAVTSVAFPNLVRLYANSEANFIIGARTVTKVLLTFIAPLACLFFIIADPLIMRIYGSEFSAAILTLQIAICATVPGFLNAFLLILLQAIGKQRLAAILMLPFIVIQVVAAFYLIPSHGAHGAASAFAIAEVCHFVILTFAVSRFVKIRELSRDLWKILVPVAVLVSVSSMATALDEIPRLIYGTLSFLILLLFLKPFTDGEMQWLRTSLADTPRHNRSIQAQ